MGIMVLKPLFYLKLLISRVLWTGMGGWMQREGRFLKRIDYLCRPQQRLKAAMMRETTCKQSKRYMKTYHGMNNIFTCSIVALIKSIKVVVYTECLQQSQAMLADALIQILENLQSRNFRWLLIYRPSGCHRRAEYSAIS